jgi:hypothetical protein
MKSTLLGAIFIAGTLGVAGCRDDSHNAPSADSTPPMSGGSSAGQVSVTPGPQTNPLAPVGDDTTRPPPPNPNTSTNATPNSTSGGSNNTSPPN